MRFGGSQLPIRLRVARAILYCQAAIMVLIGAFALEVLVIGGGGMGLPLTGVVDKQTLPGSGVTTLAVILVAVAIVLVLMEQQVAKRGGGARLVLAGAELAVAVFLIGFVAVSVGVWFFGPVCGAAVLILHYWPELHSYFYASDAPTLATDVPMPPAPAALRDSPVPPAAAYAPAEPNSDATPRPHL